MNFNDIPTKRKNGNGAAATGTTVDAKFFFFHSVNGDNGTAEAGKIDKPYETAQDAWDAAVLTGGKACVVGLEYNVDLSADDLTVSGDVSYKPFFPSELGRLDIPLKNPTKLLAAADYTKYFSAYGTTQRLYLGDITIDASWGVILFRKTQNHITGPGMATTT